MSKKKKKYVSKKAKYRDKKCQKNNLANFRFSRFSIQKLYTHENTDKTYVYSYLTSEKTLYDIPDIDVTWLCHVLP